jgi:galactokinase
MTHWIRYAQAAARVLPGLKRGLQAYVSGPLIGAGLSSSASVGLAYIKALADVNEMELSDIDLVHLDVELENGQLRLQNGILDPLTIVHGKRNALLFMETATASVNRSDPPALMPPGSPIPHLTGTYQEGYNVRVRNVVSCACWRMERLSEVPRRIRGKKNLLPPHLSRRAEHFFGEIKRVHTGARAWQESNLELFGQLMNQSCESSIKNYESGSEILIELHELVSNTNGISGSRFSGGGYGGC